MSTPDTQAAPDAAPAGGAAADAAPGPNLLARLHARLRRWTPAILVANLIGQMGIIVTGGAVRLTESGLGCSTWPECEPGRFTPAFHEATTLHPYIEFGNRTLTGVLGLLALAVFLVMFSDTARTRGYRLLGLVPGIGVIAQAVIGGVVVLLDLHPGWVSLHFGVSGALVALSLYLLHRSAEGDGPPRVVVPAPARALAWALGALTVVVVVLGVLTTGAGPHSGDAEVGYRLALDPAEMSKAHAAVVWAFLAALAAYLVVLHGPGARTGREQAPPAAATGHDAAGPDRLRVARRSAWLLVAITLAQGGIGYVQYFTGLPALLVGLHMLGAALLIAGTTRVFLTTRVR
ncbi:COX15/CtaA family protein [Myceligenerans salitolerans]|uniref:COX15/CtaA family protein n=1 Tax=Myceligenerans salitolerans TaxID=1230528 RepID=A0ABS3I482_9MICO|nr:COX15/CtaA family protein [Myceligenerans salitolerans]MBO0607775.1 COX15/CtaA family protein [Myceligenerans salitolerans]